VLTKKRAAAERHAPEFVAQNGKTPLIDHILAKQSGKRDHQPAMPWSDVPAFVKKHVVKFKQGEATRAALLFLILTAARSGEVHGAIWDEFDLEAGIWTIPSERLSDMVLTSFLRRVKAHSDTPRRVATAHGFRSSFRDWASEQGYARDLAERALAHTVANKVEAAYHRTDLLEQRRPLMEAWAKHVCGL
jgi:integrase